MLSLGMSQLEAVSDSVLLFDSKLLLYSCLGSVLLAIRHISIGNKLCLIMRRCFKGVYSAGSGAASPKI